MRRAAATRKWPEPQAGSQTVRDSSSATMRSVGSGSPAAALLLAALRGVVDHRVEGRVEQAAR